DGAVAHGHRGARADDDAGTSIAGDRAAKDHPGCLRAIHNTETVVGDGATADDQRAPRDLEVDAWDDGPRGVENAILVPGDRAVADLHRPAVTVDGVPEVVGNGAVGDGQVHGVEDGARTDVRGAVVGNRGALHPHVA